MTPEAAAKALRSVSLPDVVTVDDLACHLRLSPSAVRAALREGRIPGRRVGRRWLISRPALLASFARPARPAPHLLETSSTGEVER